MPPILVPSSAKRIATQILIIAKLNCKKLVLEALFVISSVPARKYLFKVSNWSARIRCENYSRLRMKTLERCQWRHSSVFIVNCKDILIFVLIVEFEKAFTWFMLKNQTLLKIRSGISCVMFLFCFFLCLT